MLGQPTVAADMPLPTAAIGAVVAVGRTALAEPAATVLTAGRADPALAVVTGSFALVTAVLTAGWTAAGVTVRVGAIGVEQKKSVND
jgi:hypothetical protein